MTIFEINAILSCEIKAKIIAHFWECACSGRDVTELCLKIRSTQSNFSKHIKKLETLGILLCEQVKKNRFYSINPKWKEEWKYIVEPQVHHKNIRQFICPCEGE